MRRHLQRALGARACTWLAMGPPRSGAARPLPAGSREAESPGAPRSRLSGAAGRGRRVRADSGRPGTWRHGPEPACPLLLPTGLRGAGLARPPRSPRAPCPCLGGRATTRRRPRPWTRSGRCEERDRAGGTRRGHPFPVDGAGSLRERSKRQPVGGGARRRLRARGAQTGSTGVPGSTGCAASPAPRQPAPELP